MERDSGLRSAQTGANVSDPATEGKGCVERPRRLRGSAERVKCNRDGYKNGMRRWRKIAQGAVTLAVACAYIG